jgi:hypothetical protein
MRTLLFILVMLFIVSLGFTREPLDTQIKKIRETMADNPTIKGWAIEYGYTHDENLYIAYTTVEDFDGVIKQIASNRSAIIKGLFSETGKIKVDFNPKK